MVIKSKIFIKCNTKELTVETFVRIESRILISIWFFWLEIIIYEILLALRESLLALSQLSIPTSSLFTVAWTSLMSLSNAKTVVSSAKWTTRIWFEDLYMSLIYKRKSTRPNTEPCRTTNVTVDIEKLQFLIETYCFLLLKCYSNYYYYKIKLTLLKRVILSSQDSSDAIMQELTHQYVMINCVECFWEI